MTGGWLETIAAKADLRPTEAELALRKRGIQPDRPLRPARTLTSAGSPSKARNAVSPMV